MAQTPPIKFFPAAAVELRAARDWYAKRSATAAVRFIAAFQDGLSQIIAAPERWPQFSHGTRRYRLNRFPFLIVYRIRLHQIEIIACQHAHRRPGYWRRRL